jgi:putative acetyltransferase
MDIRVGELKNLQVIALLQEHHRIMLTLSPEDSVHALDLSALEQPDITFYSLWSNNQLAGVGAIKELNADNVEIKSMRTASSHLRQGVAAKILKYIIEQATIKSYKNIKLETGTMDAFFPAHALYQKFGFRECAPFGDYKIDSCSMYMTKKLG